MKVDPYIRQAITEMAQFPWLRDLMLREREKFMEILEGRAAGKCTLDWGQRRTIS